MSDLIGNGNLNEWAVQYSQSAASYQGYIVDTQGNRFRVDEADALNLTILLNGLVEALGDIATSYGTDDPGYPVRCAAYDELDELGQIVRTKPLRLPRDDEPDGLHLCTRCRDREATSASRVCHECRQQEIIDGGAE